MIAVLIIQSRAISSLSPVGDCVIGARAVFSRWTEASEAAACTGQLQQLAAGGAGEGLRDHPLPRHLHEGGPGPQTGPHRGQSAGNWITELSQLLFIFICKGIFYALQTILSVQQYQVLCSDKQYSNNDIMYLFLTHLYCNWRLYCTSMYFLFQRKVEWIQVYLEN